MEAVPMKVRYRDADVPYPLSVVRGRLKLSGLSEKLAVDIIDNICDVLKNPTEESILQLARESIDTNNPSIVDNFDTLSKYEILKGESNNIPSIVVVLEGASATGKSIVGLEVVNNLVATRFISSDTVRQVLRSTMSKEDYPELYCHTYQAYHHRQAGNEDLDPVIRGYLAQCDIITPQIIGMTKRIISEGVTGVVEGVHILPGMLQKISPGVIEILIHPNDETHRAMFTSKHTATKLRTVTMDIETRESEYASTRMIQNYLLILAQEAKVPIVEMNDFEEAIISVSKLVVESVRRLVSDFEEESRQ